MKGLRKKLRKCLKILSIILSKTLKIKENFRILRKTYYSHVPNLGRFLGDRKFQNRPKFGKFSG
jgi:hypothetical protein